jgi:hypothetical protein
MCCHLQADQRSHQRCPSPLEVDVVAVEVTQPLLRPVARRLSTRPVNLWGTLRDVSEDGHVIVTHFQVASEDGQVLPLLALAVHQLACAEIRQESRMARQNTQVTLRPWDMQLIYLLLRQDTRRRDNFHRQRHD